MQNDELKNEKKREERERDGGLPSVCRLPRKTLRQCLFFVFHTLSAAIPR